MQRLGKLEQTRGNLGEALEAYLAAVNIAQDVHDHLYSKVNHEARDSKQPTHEKDLGTAQLNLVRCATHGSDQVAYKREMTVVHGQAICLSSLCEVLYELGQVRALHETLARTQQILDLLIVHKDPVMLAHHEMIKQRLSRLQRQITVSG